MRMESEILACTKLYYQNNLTKQVKMPQSQTTDQPTAQQMLVLLKYLKLLEQQACFHWVSYCLYKQGVHQMFLLCHFVLLSKCDVVNANNVFII